MVQIESKKFNKYVAQAWATSKNLTLRIEVYNQDDEARVNVHLNGNSKDFSIDELQQLLNL